MKLIRIAGFLLIFAELSFANSFQDDSHGYGADVLAFRFNQTGRLIAAPAYVANAQLNEFYTRRIGSLIRGRTTVAEVQTLFGHPQATSRRPDGFVYYYTLDVFNPFEQLGSGRR